MARTFNQYKISKQTTGNKTGDAYGLNVPREIYVETNPATRFKVSMITAKVPIMLEAGQYIIYKSGLDLNLAKKNISEVSFNQLTKN